MAAKKGKNEVPRAESRKIKTRKTKKRKDSGRKRPKNARTSGKTRQEAPEGSSIKKDELTHDEEEGDFPEKTQSDVQVAYKVLPHKEDFLLELTNNNYSSQTTYNYDRDLAVLEGFLTINGIDFKRVDKRLIMQYKGFLQSGNYLDDLLKISWERLFLSGKKPNSGRAGKGKAGALASKSVNRMLSALRSYLSFLNDFDLEPRPISADDVKLVKLERKKSQVAELKDLIRLIESPSEFETKKNIKRRNRAMLELLFSTGMRISELVKLDREQLDLSAAGEGGQGKIFITGKGKKQRIVYLTPRAKNYLLEYLQTRKDQLSALFIPYRGGRYGRRGQRISPNYVQAKIAEYRRRLGIVVPTSAHSLRHGFATYLAEQGASPAAIQVLLGHESLHTTDKYVHASDKFAAKTHRDFHPLYEPTSQ